MYLIIFINNYILYIYIYLIIKKIPFSIRNIAIIFSINNIL